MGYAHPQDLSSSHPNDKKNMFVHLPFIGRLMLTHRRTATVGIGETPTRTMLSTINKPMPLEITMALPSLITTA